MFYKLDENKNVIPSSCEEWANSFTGNDRLIAKDIINDFVVSTIFLGLCHSCIPNFAPPLVFETMVFQNDKNNVYQGRYSTWKEAEEGHQRAIQWVKDGCKDDE